MPSNKLFSVYILANRRYGVLYVGVTSNLSRRIDEHKKGIVAGFTRTHGVKQLVYFEAYPSMLEAPGAGVDGEKVAARVEAKVGR